MKTRPFRVFLAFLYESTFLPSRWMFDAYWRAMKARMVYVWGEPLWVEYVFRVYFHQVKMHKDAMLQTGFAVVRPSCSRVILLRNRRRNRCFDC